MSLGLVVLIVITSVGVVFLLWVFFHLSVEARRKQSQQRELPTIVSSAMHSSVPQTSSQDQSRMPTSRSSRQKE